MSDIDIFTAQVKGALQYHYHRFKTTLSYHDLGMSLASNGFVIGLDKCLNRITKQCWDSYPEGDFILTALVIDPATGMPADSFFEYCQTLGFPYYGGVSLRLDTPEQRRDFWLSRLKRLGVEPPEPSSEATDYPSGMHLEGWIQSQRSGSQSSNPVVPAPVD